MHTAMFVKSGGEAAYIHFTIIYCIWHGLVLETVEEIGDVAILMLRHRLRKMQIDRGEMGERGGSRATLV